MWEIVGGQVNKIQEPMNRVLITSTGNFNQFQFQSLWMGCNNVHKRVVHCRLLGYSKKLDCGCLWLERGTMYTYIYAMYTYVAIVKVDGNYSERDMSVAPRNGCTVCAIPE